ncbi:hypothetical protein F5B18DRAFT_242700 [Nemania serpens]|nr:hypothetical protein F5B18DRAFT_242700 [Nemania serpens]
MSDAALAIPADQATYAVCQVRPAATVSEDTCEGLSKMAIHEPATLAALPPELVLAILGLMKRKKDWLALARTCRRVSNIVVSELDKYNATKGKHYALWYACVASKPDILLRHISHDATLVDRYFTRSFRHKSTNSCFGLDMTPLVVAITAGRADIVRRLLANGADANRPDHRPVLGNVVLWYPINWAVTSTHDGSVSVIEMLKAHSADMNQAPKDFLEGVPECPRGMRCAPIFRLLLLEKPRPWPSRHGRPTSCETFNDDLRRLQDLRRRQLLALLQGGVDPNKRYDSDLVTPIFFLLTCLSTYTPSFYFEDRLMLSQEGDAQANLVNDIVTSFLDVLRDFGADISALGHIYFYREPVARRISAAYPETPLHATCRLNDRHRPVLNWFLRNGVPINSLGAAQSTPLMAYCGSRFTDVGQFQAFLDGGAEVNHQDILGRTALHDLCANIALQSQVKEKAVRMMLDMGADPTLLSHEGRVPAEEIDWKKGVCSTQDGVLMMLREASVKWEARYRKREKRKQTNKDRRVASEPRPRIKADCANHKSGQEGRVNVDGDTRREAREDNHGSEQVDHRTVNPVGTRGQNQGTVSRGDRVNRGCRHNSRGNNRHGLRDSDGNRGNDQSNDRQGIFPASGEKDARPEHSRDASRGTFYSNMRGGRYCGGGSQGSCQTVDRGTDRGRRGNNRNKNPDSHRRGYRGAHHQSRGDAREVDQDVIQESLKWEPAGEYPPTG